MKISDIGASLQFGKFITGKWLTFIYFSLSIMLLLPTITILMLILTFTIGMEWDGAMISALIGGNVFVGLIGTVFIILIVRNKKLRQKISLWLENSVQVKAYSKRVDSVRLGIQPQQVKIQIDFTIDGKKYSRVSAGKMLGGGPEGYHKIWAYYADREINILYSPKYDQVLILKDKI